MQPSSLLLKLLLLHHEPGGFTQRNGRGMLHAYGCSKSAGLSSTTWHCCVWSLSLQKPSRSKKRASKATASKAAGKKTPGRKGSATAAAAATEDDVTAEDAGDDDGSSKKKQKKAGTSGKQAAAAAASTKKGKKQAAEDETAEGEMRLPVVFCLLHACFCFITRRHVPLTKITSSVCVSTVSLPLSACVCAYIVLSVCVAPLPVLTYTSAPQHPCAWHAGHREASAYHSCCGQMRCRHGGMADALSVLQGRIVVLLC